MGSVRCLCMLRLTRDRIRALALAGKAPPMPEQLAINQLVVRNDHGDERPRDNAAPDEEAKADVVDERRREEILIVVGAVDLKDHPDEGNE